MGKSFRLCRHCLRMGVDGDGTCPSCRFDGYPRNPWPLLPEGTAIGGGRYMLGRKEGQGGFSICYRAWDGVKDEIVAAKELFPAGITERLDDGTIRITPQHRHEFAVAIRSLLHEATILRQLAEVPSIVRVLDVEQDNGTAYLLMEYLRGQAYETYLQAQYNRTGTHLEVPTAINVALTVLGALDAVHARGLLHLDVKPANIRVLDDARMVLLDFGSARDAFRKSNGPYGDTFTPGFAAPEQHHPDGLITAATDVYALAATLYFSLSLRLPTRADERERGGCMTALSSLNPRVPPALDQVVQKAMAIDARARYHSVADLRDALAPFAISSSSGHTVAAPQALRIVAGLLDAAAVMLVLSALAAAPLFGPEHIVMAGLAVWWLTQLLPYAAGATPGMLLTGLQLSAEAGHKVGMRALLVRPATLLLTLVSLRYRPDATGRLLHDRLCRCRVTIRQSLRLDAPAQAALPRKPGQPRPRGAHRPRLPRVAP